MKSKVFALVDCNNFFASCERVFNPNLNNKPIVVLSNNDGCIIARSDEAKALDIAMGIPYFKVKDLCKEKNVHVFSTNFSLYNDMSKRVMSSLREFTPNMEVYSVDEAFLDLTGFIKEDLYEYGELLKQKIKQWTGLPVSVGIAPTKTLAKVANLVAKKYSKDGICNLMENKELNECLLKLIDIKELWGIGKKWSAKLNSLGINTIWDLREADSRMIRKHFSVIGQRIVYELRGVSCLGLAEVSPKKSITSSRSFGMPITHVDDLEEAVSCFASRASIKLREQGSYARGIYVYIKTNKFSKDSGYIYTGEMEVFEIPTNSTTKIIKYAKLALNKIYQKGYKYKKAGIVLLDLIDQNEVQDHLFYNVHNNREQVLHKIIDGINKKMGTDTLRPASLGTTKKWRSKKDKLSSQYTTHWNNLPIVSAL